jgi:hypothetical protein
MTWVSRAAQADQRYCQRSIEDATEAVAVHRIPTFSARLSSHTVLVSAIAKAVQPRPARPGLSQVLIIDSL